MDMARMRLGQLQARFRHMLRYFLDCGYDTFVTGLGSDFERTGAEQVIALRGKYPAAGLFITGEPLQEPNDPARLYLQEHADGRLDADADSLLTAARAAIIYYDGDPADPFRREAERMAERGLSVVDIAPTAAARPYDRAIPQPVIDEMVFQGSPLTGRLEGKWMLSALQEEHGGDGRWSVPQYLAEGDRTSVRDYRNARRVVYQEVVVGECVPDLADIGEPGFADKLAEPGGVPSEDLPALRTGERGSYMNYEFDRESGYLNDPFNRSCRVIRLNDDELITLSFDLQNQGIVTRYIHKRIRTV